MKKPSWWLSVLIAIDQLANAALARIREREAGQARLWVESGEE